MQGSAAACMKQNKCAHPDTHISARIPDQSWVAILNWILAVWWLLQAVCCCTKLAVLRLSSRTLCVLLYFLEDLRLGIHHHRVFPALWQSSVRGRYLAALPARWISYKWYWAGEEDSTSNVS